MEQAARVLRSLTKNKTPKIALVHDYLIQDGGAERVLLAFHELYPRAPIFTLFHHPEHAHEGFKHADIRVSALNRLPFAQKRYQWYLPFMAEAIENFDLTGYDIVSALLRASPRERSPIQMEFIFAICIRQHVFFGRSDLDILMIFLSQKS